MLPPLSNPSDLKFWHENSFGEEICGVVIGRMAYRLRNSHPHPEKDFRVSPEDLQQFFEAHPDSLQNWTAVFHSHPSGKRLPSDEDLRWHPGHVALIIVTTEGLSCYRVEEQEYTLEWFEAF